jgi:hypothetical protein
MRGGAEALEGRDPGFTACARKPSTEPNRITFLLPVSFFYFCLSLFSTGRGRSEGWYAAARWSGGYQAGYSREGDGGRTAERRW